VAIKILNVSTYLEQLDPIYEAYDLLPHEVNDLSAIIFGLFQMESPEDTEQSVQN
jgi:hypothetical protein